MNINEYVPFLILLYSLPMKINGYVPFLINTPHTIVGGGENILSSHHKQQLPSLHCWQVLYFVNVIKISISFPTSILVISHSVTFLLGYNNL